MIALISFVLAVLASPFKSNIRLEAENAVLRHQLIVLRRKLKGRAACHGYSRQAPTAPASPWQNGFAERLIGSIRRECLDHIIVLGKKHLRRILKNYADYYNGVRTHRSFNKDAPVSRQVQRSGVINSRAILGGLHRQYVRI